MDQRYSVKSAQAFRHARVAPNRNAGDSHPRSTFRRLTGGFATGKLPPRRHRTAAFRVPMPTSRMDPRRYEFISDLHRPLFHFVAPANYMGDPNGTVYWKGKYHLFYQYNPHGAYDSSRDMHWGHAVSQDLVHWEDLPIALTPDPDGCDPHGCWSGGAFVADGTPTLIYYGHPNGNCLATSNDDMVVWEKHPANPVIPHPPEAEAEWKPFDPCMWKEGEIYYSLAGGRLDAIGDTAFLFKSTDMLNWEDLHPLYENTLNEPAESDCAVPDFFPLGDKHMLLFGSHERGGQYYLGTWRDEVFHPEQHGRFNFGDVSLSCGNAFAPLTLLDDAGRRIMFCWITEGRTEEASRQAGWYGAMTLPSVFSQDADGLRIAPVEELERLRRNHRSRRGIRLAEDQSIWLDEFAGGCLELKVVLEPVGTGALGLAVRCAPDLSEQTTIFYDGDAGDLVLDPAHSSLNEEAVGRGEQRAPLDLSDAAPIELRVFVDRSVLEVFANERLVLIKRIYPEGRDSTGVRLFAKGTAASIRSIDAWDMAPVWPVK